MMNGEVFNQVRGGYTTSPVRWRFVLGSIALSIVLVLAPVLPANAQLVQWRDASSSSKLWYSFCCLSSTDGGYSETTNLWIGDVWNATGNAAGFWDSAIGTHSVTNNHLPVGGDWTKNYCKWEYGDLDDTTNMECSYST